MKNQTIGNMIEQLECIAFERQKKIYEIWDMSLETDDDSSLMMIQKRYEESLESIKKQNTVLMKIVQEVDKWIDEKMKIHRDECKCGEWRKKMNQVVEKKKEKTYFHIHFDINDLEWSKERYIILDENPISFGDVIRIWVLVERNTTSSEFEWWWSEEVMLYFEKSKICFCIS
jgi:hypothetical protein